MGFNSGFKGLNQRVGGLFLRVACARQVRWTQIFGRTV